MWEFSSEELFGPGVLPVRDKACMVALQLLVVRVPVLIRWQKAIQNQEMNSGHLSEIMSREPMHMDYMLQDELSNSVSRVEGGEGYIVGILEQLTIVNRVGCSCLLKWVILQ